MSFWDLVFLVAGLALQALILNAMLLRGVWRRYTLVFFYVSFSLLSTVTQVSFRHHFGPRSREFTQAYWIADFIGTFLVLMIIIHLIRVALVQDPRRNVVYAGLLLGLFVSTGGLLVWMRLSGRSFTWGRWMTEVGRDYYFAALLLNAVLWVALLRFGHTNRVLFLLTSGLGMQLAGAAIAHALRFTGAPVGLANSVLFVSYLGGLWVWYFAFHAGQEALDSAKSLTPQRAKIV